MTKLLEKYKNIIAIVILVLSLVIGYWMIDTKPPAHMRPQSGSLSVQE